MARTLLLSVRLEQYAKVPLCVAAVFGDRQLWVCGVVFRRDVRRCKRVGLHADGRPAGLIVSLCDHYCSLVCRPRPGIADDSSLRSILRLFLPASAWFAFLASRDLPRIILFGIAGVIIASVSAAQRRTATSLRRTRDELQDALNDLKTVNERLVIENRVATLGEMSASIAHEVNQPLAAIVTQGEANLRWLSKPLPEMEQVHVGLKQMISNARRASNVVNRIRALSQKNMSERALLDVNEVINEVIKLVDREIGNHEVSLRVELAAALPLVLGDRVQLQQVIINIVINGIQAVANVDNRARSLLIRSIRDQADHVVVSVQDSGIGIDTENVNRLFEPFYTTKSQGTGMGLSICRSIIEAHGGRIWASSNSGAGATFYFALPSHREPTHDPKEPSTKV